MGSRDFLHKHVETPLYQHYDAGGALCALSTNCEQVIEAARGSFLPIDTPSRPVDFRVRLWVDDADPAPAPWPTPYVRGVGNAVFIGFDSHSSLLADLGTRRVSGRFSAAMAGDTAHWRAVIFPMLLSIMAGSVGLVELHASCVARDRQGLVLIGPSRSGKSTLAMALTEAGFRLLSDDRVFCSFKQGKLRAYGLPRPLKLRRDASSWFAELRDREPNAIQSGERVFYCEPDGRCEQQSIPACEPQSLLFLDRQQSSGFSLSKMDRSEVRRRIERDLLAEAPDAVEKQDETLHNLMTLPSWQLHYGGNPHVIAEQIEMSMAASMC